MPTFEPAISIVSAVVAGIVVLTIFYKLVSWLAPMPTRVVEAARLTIADTLDSKSLCTVYVKRGKVFKDVRLIGATRTSHADEEFPLPLYGMVILEDTQSQRTLISADSIWMIELGPRNG